MRFCRKSRNQKERYDNVHHKYHVVFFYLLDYTCLHFKPILMLVYQIQFREKVLWTAITLFIFLVCCQVSLISQCMKNAFKYLLMLKCSRYVQCKKKLRARLMYCFSPSLRSHCLGSCLQIQQIHSTGWESSWPPTEVSLFLYM